MQDYKFARIYGVLAMVVKEIKDSSGRVTSHEARLLTSNGELQGWKEVTSKLSLLEHLDDPVAEKCKEMYNADGSSKVGLEPETVPDLEAARPMPLCGCRQCAASFDVLHGPFLPR